MERPSHLVLTSDRLDAAVWLTEMIDHGWKLVSVDRGLFYFENMDVIAARATEALQRNYNENGSFRSMIKTTSEEAVNTARREMRL